MTEIGAVVIHPDGTLGETFYGKMKPISEHWVPQALAVTGRSRQETLSWPEPRLTMIEFLAYVRAYGGRDPRFVSDNNGFDWMFVCWYFWHFLQGCPFGFSSDNINSLYKGARHSLRASFKHLRDTPHDHHPVNDATSNAEALVKIAKEFNIKLLR